MYNRKEQQKYEKNPNATFCVGTVYLHEGKQQKLYAEITFEQVKKPRQIRFLKVNNILLILENVDGLVSQYNINIGKHVMNLAIVNYTLSLTWQSVIWDARKCISCIFPVINEQEITALW